MLRGKCALLSGSIANAPGLLCRNRMRMVVAFDASNNDQHAVIRNQWYPGRGQP